VNKKWTKSSSALLVCALVAVTVGGVVYYQRSAAREAAEEQLRSLGMPLTYRELDALYLHPPLGSNAAPIFEKAQLHLVAVNNTTAEADLLPKSIGGHGELPAPGDPIPEDLIVAARDHVRHNDEALRLVYEAVALPGCRFSIELNQPVTNMRHTLELRAIAHLLSLESFLWIAEDRPHKAVKSVVAITGVARSLTNEPLLISQLSRGSITHIGASGLAALLSRTTLSHDDLDLLESAFSKEALGGGFLLSLAGESATITGTSRYFIDEDAFYFFGNTSSDGLLPKAMEPVKTGYQRLSYSILNFRDADLAKHMESLARLIAIAGLPYPQRLDEAQMLEVNSVPCPNTTV
jgi:hypothetical protein